LQITTTGTNLGGLDSIDYVALRGRMQECQGLLILFVIPARRAEWLVKLLILFQWSLCAVVDQSIPGICAAEAIRPTPLPSIDGVVRFASRQRKSTESRFRFEFILQIPGRHFAQRSIASAQRVFSANPATAAYTRRGPFPDRSRCHA
jgi:hypothetical protein